MRIDRPRLVILDTATLAFVAQKPTELLAKELRAILFSGDWIVYITWHHLEELLCHGSNEVVDRRVEFLDGLPHLCYLRLERETGTVGSSLDIRDLEVSVLVDNPGISHQEVINAVSPKAHSGYGNGHRLVTENLEWWRFFRAFLAQETRRSKEEIANVTHFAATDIKARLPLPGKTPIPCTAAEGAVRLKALGQKLEREILSHGDTRDMDARSIADRFTREVLSETAPLLNQGSDFIDSLLQRDGISRSRMPPRATVEDLGYEAIFIAQMSIHSRRLLRNKNELIRGVRKEQIPAWLIWQEVDRRMKQLPKAEVGNVNDKQILSFALYVDVLNVDKRIAEILRQAAYRRPLLEEVHRRVPEGRGLSGLIKCLKTRPQPLD